MEILAGLSDHALSSVKQKGSNKQTFSPLRADPEKLFRGANGVVFFFCETNEAVIYDHLS